ncbi:hypothetical protein ABIA38_004695 [Embleya sp. AB8]
MPARLLGLKRRPGWIYPAFGRGSLKRRPGCLASSDGVRRGRVVVGAAVSSLHVPSGAGSLLGASHPLLPVHYVAVAALVGFAGSWSGAVGRLGVGVLGCWRGGPGSVRRGRVVAAGHRLVVARPLRGRGFFLVLRIRCCPSTTWPLPPWSASPDSWSGAVVRGASGGGSAAAQAFGPCWVWVAGVAVCMWAAGSGSWVGCVSGARFSSGVRGLFCLVVPRFRLGEHETRTRRPAQMRVPGKTAGRASSRALGVSSGSVFGPEERAGAVRGCETRHGHRPPGAAAGTTAPDRESEEVDQGSDGHVVDGQQRMRSTKKKPRPRRGRATTRRGQPPRPGPAERTRGHRAPAQHHDARAADRPRPRTSKAVPGSDGHVVDGQQRMRSTKQRPRPRRGRAATRRWQPSRVGPAERTRGHRAPAQHHDAKRPTAPDHEPAKPSRAVTAT